MKREQYFELWEEAGQNPARYFELLKKHGLFRYDQRQPVIPNEQVWSPYPIGREVAS